MYLKDIASCFLPPNLASAKENGRAREGQETSASGAKANLASAKEVGESTREAGNFGV